MMINRDVVGFFKVCFCCQCTALVLQCFVYNNAVNCSGSRKFPDYKEPLNHFYYIRYIFALSASSVLLFRYVQLCHLPNYL